MAFRYSFANEWGTQRTWNAFSICKWIPTCHQYQHRLHNFRQGREGEMRYTAYVECHFDVLFVGALRCMGEGVTPLWSCSSRDDVHVVDTIHHRQHLLARFRWRCAVRPTWCNLNLKIISPASRTRDFTVVGRYNYRYVVNVFIKLDEVWSNWLVLKY